MKPERISDNAEQRFTEYSKKGYEKETFLVVGNDNAYETDLFVSGGLTADPRFWNTIFNLEYTPPPTISRYLKELEDRLK